MKQRILLVEDEENLAFSLTVNLEAEGFEVEHVSDGAAAYKKALGPLDFALVVLDVMLPEIDGFKIAKILRANHPRLGILMLTALAGDEDRIKGLETGVDDYLTKPFVLEEFLARVRRMAERSKLLAGGSQKALTFGPFSLDMDNLVLSGPPGQFPLTSLEADLLSEFAQNLGKCLSRDHLLRTVWQMKSGVQTRTVDNFIVRLRKVLEKDQLPQSI